jgi:hypothetical protein
MKTVAALVMVSIERPDVITMTGFRSATSACGEEKRPGVADRLHVEQNAVGDW